MKKSIIMGFDFGLKNIGIAVGQKVTYTAQPITTLKAKIGNPDWNKIKNILLEWNPEILIVGLPINIDGTNQLLTYITCKFATKLKKEFKLKVIMHDERFSTTEARSNLFIQNGYRSLQKNQINSISAAIILEGWLQQNQYTCCT